MPQSAGPFRLFLLGPIDLRTPAGGAAGTILTQPKRFAVLAYLAMASPGVYVRRDRILATFWPDQDQDRARAALRDALYHLRRTLDADLIQTRGAEDVRLDASRIAVDVHEFQGALARGDSAAAVRLYRGDFLDGFHVPGAPTFADWVDRERTDLRGQAVGALTAIAADALDRNDPREAAVYYRRALAASPYAEGLLFGLMESLELDGHGPAAVAEADRFVLRLSEDLDLKPSATLCRKVELLQARIAASGSYATADPRDGGIKAQPDSVSTAEDRESDVAFGASVPPTASTTRAGARPFWRRGLPITVGALIVAAIAAAKFGLGTEATPVPDDVSQIVIAPFAVRGDARISYLREGMVDLLVAKLDGAPGIRVVDPKAMLENVPRRGNTGDLEVARGLARRFGAQHFITGTVVQGGTALQITATLYDALGAVVARSDRVATSEADLFPAIDDLARELVAGLLTSSEAPLASLAARTTASYPAVQQYLHGEQYFRAGKYDDAVASFQDAVERDTTFALAYYRLSSAADWAGQASVAESAAHAAMRHRERLPTSAADLVTARWEFWFGDVRRADEIYRELTSARPTDVEAWFERGEVLFHGGPWMGRSMRDAEPAFRRVLSLDPSHIGAMMHLARVAALKGDVALLDSLLARAQNIDPSHDRTLEIRGLRAGLRNDARAMDSVIGRLSVHRDALKIDADAERIAVYTGNLAFAERIARISARPGRPRADRVLSLQSVIHMAAGQGQWQEAKRQLDVLATLDPVIAAQVRANLTVMPFIGASAADIARARRDLEAVAPAALAGGVDAGEGGAAADPHHFQDARRRYQLGLLAVMAGDAGATTYIAALEADSSSTNIGIFQRSLAGSLRAHMLAQRGDSTAALAELQRSWLPPRKPLMIGWAWTHSNVTDRLFLATLLAHAGRSDEALRWIDAVREDIAGSPVVMATAERLRRRIATSSSP